MEIGRRRDLGFVSSVVLGLFLARRVAASGGASRR